VASTPAQAMLALVPAAVTDVAALATLQRQAEADGAAAGAMTVADADEYAFADAVLTDIVTRKDAAVAMRKRATAHMYAAAREVESWFRPLVGALESGEGALKRAMGAYRARVAAEAAAARELAAQAADAGDAEGLHAALSVAAAPPPEGRARVRMVWRVKRIAEGLLPREYWCVDRAKIDAAAKAAKGDEPPVIPGVEFVREAEIGAKR